VASNFYSALDPVMFTLGQALRLTGDSRTELAVELQFYGLLDRVMPFYAQEQIGVALLKSACNAGATKGALQAAVATARALVFEIGSTTPWLTAEFQDLRYVITVRVVNGAPVWAAEGGKWFMYRDGEGKMWISTDANCAAGKAGGLIYNTSTADEPGRPEVRAPTQLPSKTWMSNKYATLGPQLTTALATTDKRWVEVPGMRINAVHGLDDAEPAMAAALRQLAALPDDDPSASSDDDSDDDSSSSSEDDVDGDA